MSVDAGGVLCCIVQPAGSVSFRNVDGGFLCHVPPETAARSKKIQGLMIQGLDGKPVPIATSRAGVLAWRKCGKAVSSQSSSQAMKLTDFDDDILSNALAVRFFEI